MCIVSNSNHVYTNRLTCLLCTISLEKAFFSDFWTVLYNIPYTFKELYHSINDKVVTPGK